MRFNKSSHKDSAQDKRDEEIKNRIREKLKGYVSKQPPADFVSPAGGPNSLAGYKVEPLTTKTFSQATQGNVLQGVDHPAF